MLATSLVGNACVSVQAYDSAIEKQEDEIILADINECKAARGAERDACRDKLIEDLIRIFNAKPEVVRKALMESHGDWDLVRYTLKRYKLFTRVDVVVDHKNKFDELLDFLGDTGREIVLVAAGIGIGVAMK